MASAEVDAMMAKLWEDESSRNRRRVAEIANLHSFQAEELEARAEELE